LDIINRGRKLSELVLNGCKVSSVVVPEEMLERVLGNGLRRFEIRSRPQDREARNPFGATGVGDGSNSCIVRGNCVGRRMPPGINRRTAGESKTRIQTPHPGCLEMGGFHRRGEEKSRQSQGYGKARGRIIKVHTQ